MNFHHQLLKFTVFNSPLSVKTYSTTVFRYSWRPTAGGRRRGESASSPERFDTYITMMTKNMTEQPGESSSTILSFKKICSQLIIQHSMTYKARCFIEYLTRELSDETETNPNSLHLPQCLKLTCSVEMSHTMTLPSALQEYATFWLKNKVHRWNCIWILFMQFFAELI